MNFSLHDVTTAMLFLINKEREAKLVPQRLILRELNSFFIKMIPLVCFSFKWTMILRIKVIHRIPFVLSVHSIVTSYCVSFVLKTPHSIVSSYRILFIFYRALNLLSSNGVFERDVKAAILMMLDKETGGHVDLQTNPARIALYFYADKLFKFVY